MDFARFYLFSGCKVTTFAAYTQILAAKNAVYFTLLTAERGI